jgi:hypothetical protein
MIQEDYNKATLGLSKALKKSFTGKTPSWRTTNFKIPDNTLEFEPGIVDFSPGWFMQQQDISMILLGAYGEC